MPDKGCNNLSILLDYHSSKARTYLLQVLSFARSSPAGGKLFGVSGLLLLLKHVRY